MSKIDTVCIYSASSDNISNTYLHTAYELGKHLAHRGIGIVNGAGNRGLMRATTDGALAAHGKVTGVIPQFMVDNGWHYEALTEIIVTHDIHQRKKTMLHMSDALLALPGGCGTMEELMEAITWKQLGMYTKPLIIMNIDGYYTPLLEMLSKAIDQRFMKESDGQLWLVANSAEEAIQILDTYQ